MPQRRVALGGLGGGGDVGGALSLAMPIRALGLKPVVVSFNDCRADAIDDAESIGKAVLRITPNSRSRLRLLEPLVASLDFETYLVCLKEGRDEVIRGLKSLSENLGFEVFIAVDLGGDSLLYGDEPSLGSYKADMMSLAALSKASEEQGFKALLAVGALGLEGGGVLSLPHLARNLTRFTDAYLGCYKPPAEVLSTVLNALNYLLSRGKSAMLTLYRDALAGAVGKRRYDVAYMHGEVLVEPYHGYMFIFDAPLLCKLSKLCREVKERWVQAVKEATKLMVKPSKAKGQSINAVVQKLIRRQVSLKELLQQLESSSSKS